MKLNLSLASTTAILSLTLFTQAAQAADLSVSPVSFVEELATSREYFPEITRKQLFKELNKADILSVGETHETGFERNFLRAFYDELATKLKEKPAQCLVENYEVLLSPTDQVRASFAKTCPAEKVYDSVSSSNYTKRLADGLNQGVVLTHTGYRHMFPVALDYPNQDFPTPQWVDFPVHGTISKQVPNDFESSGKIMRGVGMRALDEMYMSRIADDMQAMLKSGVNEYKILSEVEKIRGWNEGLAFNDGQEARYFEIRRLNLSLPYVKAYVALLNRPDFKLDKLEEFLASEDFKQLLLTTNPKDLRIGCFITEGKKSSFGAGSISFSESGTIFAYSTSLKDQHIIAVSITPSRGVVTENSTH